MDFDDFQLDLKSINKKVIEYGVLCSADDGEDYAIFLCVRNSRRKIINFLYLTINFINIFKKKLVKRAKLIYKKQYQLVSKIRK